MTMPQRQAPSGSAVTKPRSPVSLIYIAYFVATIICLALPTVVNAQCTPGAFRARLSDCPVQELHPRSGDTLEMEYIPIVVDFPLLYDQRDPDKTPVWQHEVHAEDLEVQANLVQDVNSFVRFQTKTFKSPGLEAAIPCPTIYWPKGANVKVLLKNNLDRDVNDPSYRLNIHTHGLHIGPDEDDSGIIIRPTEEHLYDYHLPNNHGGGTHWYHPHVNTLSELVVGGGTAGMMVVEDEDDGSEVPNFVLAMPEQVLVILFVWPQRIMQIARGDAPNINTSSRRAYIRETLYTLEARDDRNNVVTVPDNAFYYLVNGFVRPTISFVTNQWTRLRIMHSSNGHDVKLHVEGADCKMYLLAKDGVYLPNGPREEFGRNQQGQQQMRLSASTRADFAIRCTRLTSGNPYIVAEHYKDDLIHYKVPIMGIELLGQNSDSDNFSTFSYTPCHPSYLPDLMAPNVQINGQEPMPLTVTPFSINGARWGGFIPEPTARNLTVMPLGTVQEWSMEHRHHPFHMHINHFMLAETIDDWDQVGDWVDTVHGEEDWTTFRFITDRYPGRVTMHCHNLDHADEGSMAMAFITPDPNRPELEREVEWEEDCNAQITYTCNGNCNAADWTRRPTYAPTAAPSVSPTVAPTKAPTLRPTEAPTLAPTELPTLSPTLAPTLSPTFAPSSSPTASPTLTPTVSPTLAPTLLPTLSPTLSPTSSPSMLPTLAPTLVPTLSPTKRPTLSPSVSPPTKLPTMLPSIAPSLSPSVSPTASVSLLLRGDVTINGNVEVFTFEVKTALERAMTEELRAFSVEVLTIRDLSNAGANRRRRLMDLAFELGDVTTSTVNMRRRSLQDGEQFSVQFVATYRNKEDGVYGTQRINKNSAAAVQSLMDRMTKDLGVASSPLAIESLTLEDEPEDDSIALWLGLVIGGVCLAFFLFVGMCLLKCRERNAKNEKSVDEDGNKEGKEKKEPQEDGLEDAGMMFRQKMVEAKASEGGYYTVEDTRKPEHTDEEEIEVQVQVAEKEELDLENSDTKRDHKDVGSKKEKSPQPESPSSDSSMRASSSSGSSDAVET